MHHPHHSTPLGQWLAGSENGSVYFCAQSNVVSLCLHYMTMRFEADAFRDLLGMMGFAQAEIQNIRTRLEQAVTPGRDHGATGGSCVH